MHGKGLTRLAAGTCSICICYALTMQSIRGEPVTPEWAESTALFVEPAAPTSVASAPLFSARQGESFPDYAYAHGRSGKKAGRRGKYTAPDDSGDQVEEKENAEEQSDGEADGSQQTQASGDPPTLSEFLSSLRCGGCRHNCSLFHPRCMKGRSKAQKAQTEYVQTYGSDF